MRVYRSLPVLLCMLVAGAGAPAFAQTAPFSGPGPAPAPSGVFIPAPSPPQAPSLGDWAPRDIGGFGARASSTYASGAVGPGEASSRPRVSVRRGRPTRLTGRATPRETALAGDRAASFTPQTIDLTRRALDRYARIVDAGGWPVTPNALRPGSQGPAVALLRRRLAIEGDLKPSLAEDSYNESWDQSLTAAVKRFQARVGLPQTGVVAGAALKALNVSARTRLRQLEATVNRLAAVNFSFGPRYVAVNIPSESVEAVQNGEVVRRYVAVVGSPEHRSPEIAAHVQGINLNPTWTLPASIVKNEIIPKMRRDPGYLSRERIRVLEHNGDEISPRDIDWNSDSALRYILRQDSGPHDALGLLRIDMPNNEAVYMHDTPAKGLFARDDRVLSHGCVRVEDVYDLAAWLLQSTPGGPHGRWDRRALIAGIATGEQREIMLAKSVPVIWVYMTGWADADGVVHFRNDVYGEDSGAQDMVHADLR